MCSLIIINKWTFIVYTYNATLTRLYGFIAGIGNLNDFFF